MNKSLLTNLLALLLCGVGYFTSGYGHVLFVIGVFALSGGVTNWLAIHMLFERVPLLYGSGVIPNRFEDFKKGIKSLIVTQFFTAENVERFFRQNGGNTVEALMQKVDFDQVFLGLTKAIEESKMGGMLAMFGGRDALEPLRESMIEKLKGAIMYYSQSGKDNGELTKEIVAKIEQVIDSRLEELTPQDVKQIVQEMIREHLGWLVVWGGVFGGLIGLVVALLDVA